MNLDDTQKKKVAGWLEEGLKLSEIQKKISSEFGISIKYLDLRFLLDDLKLRPKEEPRPTWPLVALPGVGRSESVHTVART